MAKSPNEFPIGTAVRFKAGPTQVERSGSVTGYDGQFVVVKVGEKEMKTRPGAIL